MVTASLESRSSSPINLAGRWMLSVTELNLLPQRRTWSFVLVCTYLAPVHPATCPPPTSYPVVFLTRKKRERERNDVRTPIGHQRITHERHSQSTQITPTNARPIPFHAPSDRRPSHLQHRPNPCRHPITQNGVLIRPTEPSLPRSRCGRTLLPDRVWASPFVFAAFEVVFYFLPERAALGGLQVKMLVMRR